MIAVASRSTVSSRASTTGASPRAPTSTVRIKPSGSPATPSPPRRRDRGRSARSPAGLGRPHPRPGHGWLSLVDPPSRQRPLSRSGAEPVRPREHVLERTCGDRAVVRPSRGIRGSAPTTGWQPPDLGERRRAHPHRPPGRHRAARHAAERSTHRLARDRAPAGRPVSTHPGRRQRPRHRRRSDRRRPARAELP